MWRYNGDWYRLIAVKRKNYPQASKLKFCKQNISDFCSRESAVSLRSNEKKTLFEVNSTRGSHWRSWISTVISLHRHRFDETHTPDIKPRKRLHWPFRSLEKKSPSHLSNPRRCNAFNSRRYIKSETGETLTRPRRVLDETDHLGNLRRPSL